MEDITIASKLKEKLGEDMVEDLEKWVREIIQSETRDQYSHILSRFDLLEARFDLLEDKYENLKDEVYRLRGEMNGLRDEMNGFRTEVNQRFDAMNNSINQRFDAINERILSSIKWSVGTIATFGLIITILVTIFKFLG
jgi:predicted nuclease with TOPRIM domain